MAIADTQPEAETIRRTALEILHGPDFRINEETEAGNLLGDFFLQILEWIVKPFIWLFRSMEGLPDVLRWLIVVALAIVLLLLVAHIVYTLFTVLKPSARKSNKFKAAYSSRRVLSAEEFEQFSQEALVEQNYIAAVRFLFRASLVRIQGLEGKLFSPGITNRAYLRRYRRTPMARSLQAFVEIIDSGWYGNRDCQEEDYLKCASAYAEISQQTKGNAHADNA